MKNKDLLMYSLLALVGFWAYRKYVAKKPCLLCNKKKENEAKEVSKEVKPNPDVNKVVDYAGGRALKGVDFAEEKVPVLTMQQDVIK